jgi:nucleotide-binding universal stress UspA family protein
MLKIKNIVVPTDFSELSLSAFNYAKDLAETMDAKIHLITVIDNTPPMLSKHDKTVSESVMMESVEQQAKKQMAELAEEINDDNDIDIIQVIRKGVDYEEIVKYSNESHADLIVLATHGRTGVLHTLLGSVAEKVIQYSKRPVLVIHPEEEEV